MNLFNHWEDIWWSYPSKMYPKTYKICEKMKAWKCDYLLNHCTNFLVWFTTNFYVYFKSLRGYMMILSPKMHPKLRKFAKNDESLKMWISTKSCYKLFSVVHNYFLCIFQIIERIYDDRMPLEKLQNVPKNL